jgi:hypothetical protein
MVALAAAGFATLVFTGMGFIAAVFTGAALMAVALTAVAREVIGDSYNESDYRTSAWYPEAASCC